MRKSGRGNQILAAVGAVGVVGLAAVAQAGNTWDGGGTNDNWSTAANWNGDAVPVWASNTLVFDGSTRLSPNNETTDRIIAGITFAPTASAFTLVGNQFKLDGGAITNNSAYLQTINATVSTAYSGAGGFTVAGSNSVTLGNLIGGYDVTLTNRLDAGKVLTLSGTPTAGMLILKGTGDTTISGAKTAGWAILRSRGTTTLANNNTYTGYTGTGGGGRIILDYGASNTSKLADAARLTFGGYDYGSFYGGVDLILKGGSHTEVVGNVASGGSGTTATHTNVKRDGGSSILQMGAVSFGSSVNFDDGVATTTTTNTNGILSKWATVGNKDWAINSSGTVTKLSSYTNLTGAGANSTNNYYVSGSLTTTTSTINSLKIVSTADNQTLNLGSSTLTTDALLYAGDAGNSNYNYTITGTGSLSGGYGRNFHVGNGTLTIDVPVGNNWLQKSGPGTLVLNKANPSYTNTMVIAEGAVRIKNGGALGTIAGATMVGASWYGTALELEGGITVGAEALTIQGNGINSGGALRNISGNNSYDGLITIEYGGARINSDISSTLTLTRGITTAAGNDVTFGGAGSILVSTVKIGGAGNVIKDGAGTTTLSANNDYTGTTAVTAGTLLVNGTQTGAGAYTVSGTGKLGGNGSIGAAGVTIAAGGKLAPGTSPGAMTMNLGSGSLDISGAVTADNSQALEFELGALAGPNDKVVLGASSTLNIGNNVLNFDDFKFTDVGSAIQAGQYMLFDTSAAIVGLLGSTLSGDLGGGKTGTLAISGQDLVLNVVVPEPTSLGLLGLAGVGTLARRRRRN